MKPTTDDLKQITTFGRIIWVMVVTAGRSITAKITGHELDRSVVKEIVSESKVVSDELQPLLEKLS